MEQVNKPTLKAKVQKLGSTLSSMVMPNIGALIAWGVLTALFIPDGYLPNKAFATMVGPMLTYLIPILIGYTGAKVVAGDRGAVVGAIATMGVIVGTDVPMMLGAMIMGPLAGFTIKQFDRLFQDKIKAGFEMLVNNFSAGLIGFALSLIGFVAIGPVVNGLTHAMAAGVEIILNAHLIPLTNIFIEPAKILFLNNAINHGILTPLGTEQVTETGRSILFLLEANPGPGLGVLLAFTLFGKGSAKASAPGAMIIHFFGGIHEIYFPYVMMKPFLFLSVIAGGVSGSFIFQLLDAGLRAPASPGSIIAILAMAPMGTHIPVILGILTATIVSFGISVIILKADAKEEDFEAAQNASQQAKINAKGQKDIKGVPVLQGIQEIIFACDAGMGSSAMGASILRKKAKEAGLFQEVTNRAINNLTGGSETLVVTQEELQERARQKVPQAHFVAVENFLNSPKYDEIVQNLSSKNETVEQPKNSEKTVEEASLEFSSVQQIVLAHDDRKGSATMGQKIVEELLEKEQINVPLKKVHIDQLSADEQTLVIAKEELTDLVNQTAPNAIHVSVSSFIHSSKYKQIISQLKAVS